MERSRYCVAIETAGATATTRGVTFTGNAAFARKNVPLRRQDGTELFLKSLNLQEQFLRVLSKVISALVGQLYISRRAVS